MLNASLKSKSVAGSVAASVIAALTFACSPDDSGDSEQRPGGQRSAFALAEPAARTGAIGFVVRFAPTHALGRAQALEAAGRRAEAERLARQTLAASHPLQGLCFDRFTLGGAETVLVSCAPVSAARSAEFQRDWLARLRAMDGVEYADVNLVVQASDGAVQTLDPRS